MSSSWQSPLAIDPSALDCQLAHLRRRGYAGLTFAESERLRAAGRLPERSVVITFDDGYRSTLEAADVLDAHGYPGTVFVVTSFVDSGRPLEWPGIAGERLRPGADRELRPLTWADLESMVARGWEVGSHTVTHPLLSALPADRVERELVESRRRIADRLGRCETIAYPYGREDGAVARAAADAGYLAACTLKGVPTADTPYLRPRVGLTSRDRGLRLRLGTSPAALGARRSRPARIASRLRPARSWLPGADDTNVSGIVAG